MTDDGARLGALSVRATVAARGFDAGLEVAPGEVVAVLGPNGAGKSTLLGLVSGLVRPDAGHVALAGRAVVDVAAGILLPPHRRAAVLLAQEPLLFPHLSVVENVAFGPRAHGLRRSAARDRARRWLAAVGAEDLADRRPAGLSGGQAQRVAIARALATEPAVLLLDEPLAALDAAAAPAVRRLLRSVLRGEGRTALLVTHDILDALALADRVVVLEDGRVAEEGPTRSVLTRPRSRFAARIAGVDLLPGVATGRGLVTPGGQEISGLRDPDCPPGSPAVALFRPNAVAVYLRPPAGSPRNLIPATVTHLESRGEVVRVEAPGTRDPDSPILADVTPAAVADLGLAPGLPVWLSVKATEVDVYAAAT